MMILIYVMTADKAHTPIGGVFDREWSRRLRRKPTSTVMPTKTTSFDDSVSHECPAGRALGATVNQAVVYQAIKSPIRDVEHAVASPTGMRSCHTIPFLRFVEIESFEPTGLLFRRIHSSLEPLQTQGASGATPSRTKPADISDTDVENRNLR